MLNTATDSLNVRLGLLLETRAEVGREGVGGRVPLAFVVAYTSQDEG